MGDDEVIIEADREKFYSDEGATCSDEYNGDFSTYVSVGGFEYPDLSKPGSYNIAYNCDAPGGAAAVTATRQVVVRDTVCPVCQLNGKASLELEASFPYSDPGAVCTDNIDGDNLQSTTNTASSVDVEKTGTYFITYRAEDQSGNWNDDATCTGGSQIIRTVKIVDTLRPVIGLRYGNKILHISDASDTAVIHKNGVEERVTNPMASYFDARRRLISVGSRSLYAVQQAPLVGLVALVAMVAVVASVVVIYRRPTAPSKFVEV
jgi:hypothetical protein